LVAIKVYDILGKEVVKLVSRWYEPGYHAMTWDASDFPSGLYFYRMTMGGYSRTIKMMLLK
jgi:hypothetical protein